MAVETFTEFPQSFIAGDTVRVSISDSKHPSTLWSLRVTLQSATTKQSFDASVGTGTGFLLVISAAASAKLGADLYTVTSRYTQTASGEKQTSHCVLTTQVYANPEGGGAKTIARQTLEAMETAYLQIGSDPNLTVNFNGQSYTGHNIKEFQTAIEHQRAIVNAEDAQRIGGRRSIGRILHPL